jgi:uncharacterized repeat protein (TIGR02059 family)
MVHNRKAIWTIIILLLTLFLLPQGGMAAEVSLELSSNRAMPGNSISALGQAESNTWVSLKILDSQQNIVLFDAVKSDPEGNYQFIFVVPDLPLGSELIVNAGYGNRIASQILTVGEPGAVPLLLSAFTNEAGSMISMEFNQLMADPAGSHEQFTVLVNGKINPVTKVALNQNPARIDLTLSQPVKHGDIIKVSYTRGTVQSADHGVLEDIFRHNMDDYLKKVHNRPVLIVQGQEDNVVAVYNARYMYNRLCNAEMVIVDDADHRFENKIRDRELITIKWLKKHFVNE